MDQAPLLNEKDVVSLLSAISAGPYVGSRTFKAVDFVQAVKRQTGIPEQWTQGMTCELLKADAPGWKKGKIRIRLEIEFIPDEPEPVETANEVDSMQALRSKLDI